MRAMTSSVSNFPLLPKCGDSRSIAVQSLAHGPLHTYPSQHIIWAHLFRGAHTTARTPQALAMAHWLAGWLAQWLFAVNGSSGAAGFNVPPASHRRLSPFITNNHFGLVLSLRGNSILAGLL